MMLTQDKLKEVLRYDHLTGVFTWAVTRGRIRSGYTAGTVKPNGTGCVYIQIIVDRTAFLAHRLAFLWMTGKVPKEVDHIDRNGLNNRWRNLRSATRSLNCANRGVQKNNSLGMKGVCRYSNGKYTAQIKVHGRSIHLGYFSDKNEAHAAYKRAAEEHFGGFASS